MTGGEGVSGCPEERVGIGDDTRRARPGDEELQREDDEVGDPEADDRRRDDGKDAAPGPRGQRRREDDPEQPREADDGQRDEDRVEPADPMFDNPEKRLAVEAEER